MKRMRIELRGQAQTPAYTLLFSDFGDAITFLCELFKFGDFNEAAGRYTVLCWNETTHPPTIVQTYYTNLLTDHLTNCFLQSEHLVIGDQ